MNLLRKLVWALKALLAALLVWPKQRAEESRPQEPAVPMNPTEPANPEPQPASERQPPDPAASPHQTPVAEEGQLEKRVHPGSTRTILLLVAVAVAFTVPVVWDVGCRGWHRFPAAPAWDVPEGNIDRGREAILAHGCGGCHVIPGIRTATGRVGPRLTGLREQTYIAGVLANTPDNLIAWIMAPQDINPLTAMPNLEVSEQEAHDITAYLYAHPRELQWPRMQPPRAGRER